MSMILSPHNQAIFAALSSALFFCNPAFAYRPFQGTDAAVADAKEVEIELQPAGVLKEGSAKSLVAPAAVVNVGLGNQWEAVFEGNGLIPLSPAAPFAVTDPAISLKHVIREGVLQERTGPSIATEF